ncbi:MAG: hypothetical protein V4582_08005 [Pseudomonadota bacterium]
MKLSAHLMALVLAAAVTAAIFYGIAAIAPPVLRWWHATPATTQAVWIVLCLFIAFGSSAWVWWRRRRSARAGAAQACDS